MLLSTEEKIVIIDRLLTINDNKKLESISKFLIFYPQSNRDLMPNSQEIFKILLDLNVIKIDKEVDQIINFFREKSNKRHTTLFLSYELLHLRETKAKFLKRN